MSRKSKRRRRKPWTIQSLVFPKDKWTKRAARNWVRVHGYDDSQLDPNPRLQAWRFRQRDPDQFTVIRGKCLTPSKAPASYFKCDIIAVGGRLRRAHRRNSSAPRRPAKTTPWWAWWS